MAERDTLVSYNPEPFNRGCIFSTDEDHLRRPVPDHGRGRCLHPAVEDPGQGGPRAEEGQGGGLGWGDPHHQERPRRKGKKKTPKKQVLFDVSDWLLQKGYPRCCVTCAAGCYRLLLSVLWAGWRIGSNYILAFQYIDFFPFMLSDLVLENSKHTAGCKTTGFTRLLCADSSNRDLINHAECLHGGPELTSGGAEDGEWVPAATEGHELQREDEGAHREVHPRNGVSKDQEPGMCAICILYYIFG